MGGCVDSVSYGPGYHHEGGYYGGGMRHGHHGYHGSMLDNPYNTGALSGGIFDNHLLGHSHSYGGFNDGYHGEGATIHIGGFGGSIL